MITAIIFIAVIGVLVLVHECGHFIMAKRAGMKVEEFGFGFPPKLWSYKKGETTYSINAIPFGGFVKVLDQRSRLLRLERVCSVAQRTTSNNSCWASR